jgi:predicted nucleic acid-binding protein
MRVVDTNVVSFGFRKDPLYDLYRRHLQGHDQVISFMTLGELRAGALCANWGDSRKLKLERHFCDFIAVDSDDDICHWYAYVLYQRWSRPTSTADAWIAATALSLKAELVTHNPADFRGIVGLKIITEAP